MNEETTQNAVVQQPRMQSDSIAKLAEALSKAQGKFEHAKKDVDNPYFKSKYADLASVIDAAKPHLSANDLAVIQTTQFDSVGKIILITMLVHKSGEFIKSEYPIKPVKDDPQGMGSAITYARRYCFSAITGIAADDDDGNAASAKKVSSAAENRKFNAFCKLIQDSENPTKFWQDNIREINNYRDEADGVEMTMLKFAHLAIIALIESSDDPASVIHEQNRLMTKMETEARIYFDAINKAAKERKEALTANG